MTVKMFHCKLFCIFPFRPTVVFRPRSALRQGRVYLPASNFPRPRSAFLAQLLVSFVIVAHGHFCEL